MGAGLVAGLENSGAGSRVGAGQGNMLGGQVFVAGLMPDPQVNMQNQQFSSGYCDYYADDEVDIQVDIYG